MAKEFLSRKGIDYEHIDVLNDSGGRERLLKLGVRNVPVVAKGDKFVFGQNLEDVAEFVGLQGTGHKPLPPDELMCRWINVLRVAQGLIRQIPDDKITEKVIRIANVRSLAGASRLPHRRSIPRKRQPKGEYAISTANVPPADGTYTRAHRSPDTARM